MLDTDDWLKRITGNPFTKLVFGTVGAHFLSLSCVQLLPNGVEKPLAFSGFLLEVRERWIFITAGHVVKLLDQAMSRGAKFARWRLDDQAAGDRFKGAAVVVDFDVRDWAFIDDTELGLDYAAFPLRDLYRKQLVAGGAMPLGRDTWGEVSEPYDQFALVGIPLETVSKEGEFTLTGKLVLLPLEPCDAPEDAERTPESKFYARIKDRGSVSDIEGMSGGPVFGLWKREEAWRYKVLAVQSTWYPNKGVTASCPIALLGEVLEDILSSSDAT